MEKQPAIAGSGAAEAAATLALAVNDRVHPYDFAVILNPAEFEATFRARLASEDPLAPWQPGVFRVRDFGVPDFSDVVPPYVENDVLIFHAVDTITGLPYRVEVPDAASEPTYQPLPLTPLPPAPFVGKADRAISPSTPILVSAKPGDMAPRPAIPPRPEWPREA